MDVTNSETSEQTPRRMKMAREFIGGTPIYYDPGEKPLEFPDDLVPGAIVEADWPEGKSKRKEPCSPNCLSCCT